MVISDDFLKSEKCMYEVLEFIKEKNYGDRIFPIVLKDAKIYKPLDRAEYINYWEIRTSELEEAIQRLDNTNAINLIEDLRLYKNISNEICSFMDLIKDKLSLKLPELQETSYRYILDKIGYEGIYFISNLIRILKIKKFETQEMELEKHHDTYGESSYYYYTKANIPYKRKDYELAFLYLKKSLALNPYFAEAHFRIADILMTDNLKDLKSARYHLEEALKIDPNLEVAHVNLGVVLIQDCYQDYKLAKEHYLKALDLNPDSAPAHYFLAMLLCEPFEDYDEAEKHYQRAILLDPKLKK